VDDVIRVSPDGRELRSLLAGAGLAGPSRRSTTAEDPAGPRDSEPKSGRRILGIAGAPGAGKSTLATAVAEWLLDAVVVPMDGFHLADAELRRRGLLERKGAPETFDGWGYAALLARLRLPPRPGEVVMAPGFERTLEQPLAGAIPLPPEASTVVTEGNYLLLDTPEWRAVGEQLDAVWFVDTDEELRVWRLVARHVEFGKTPEEARAWVDAVDQPNARLVGAGAARADVRLDLTRWRPERR
jgi:pantothenate kinase